MIIVSERLNAFPSSNNITTFIQWTYIFQTLRTYRAILALILKNPATLEHTRSAKQVQARIIDSQRASWTCSHGSEILRSVDASSMSWGTWNAARPSDSVLGFMLERLLPGSCIKQQGSLCKDGTYNVGILRLSHSAQHQLTFSETLALVSTSSKFQKRFSFFFLTTVTSPILLSTRFTF